MKFMIVLMAVFAITLVHVKAEEEWLNADDEVEEQADETMEEDEPANIENFDDELSSDENSTTRPRIKLPRLPRLPERLPKLPIRPFIPHYVSCVSFYDIVVREILEGNTVAYFFIHSQDIFHILNRGFSRPFHCTQI